MTIEKCPRCGFDDLAHDYTGMPMCLEIDGGCGWDGSMDEDANEEQADG